MPVRDMSPLWGLGCRSRENSEPEQTAGQTKSKQRVWKPYEIHFDFCEPCAMYEPGNNVDPCFVGQILWSCLYAIGYLGTLLNGNAELTAVTNLRSENESQKDG